MCRVHGSRQKWGRGDSDTLDNTLRRQSERFLLNESEDLSLITFWDPPESFWSRLHMVTN
jgi:hypothetical protein